jgi:DNA-binding transcriptional LysR family regulator
MLVRQLEYLVALSREGHFARAAEACHVSQPALSAGIRKLESELGVQVVLRGQRFEGFTPEGLEVLRWAQRVVADQEALQQTLTSMRTGLTGTLRIGAIPTALGIAAQLTTPMRAAHELVRFSIESLTSREIVAKLNDFDIDVGLTYVDGEPLGRVRVIPLYRERYVFLTPADGEFAGRTSVTWLEAADTPLCLLVPSMQNRRIIDGYFADHGLSVTPVVETDTVSAMYAHLAVMKLSTIAPFSWVKSFGPPPGAMVLRLPRPRRARHVGLVLAGRGRESLLTSALVETAQGLDLDRQLRTAMRRTLTAE